jgi:hypothetical protein
VKPCHIYRFVAAGTLENVMFDRQIVKRGMANRVVDMEQVERHFGQNELEQLFSYEVRGLLFPSLWVTIPNQCFSSVAAAHGRCVA